MVAVGELARRLEKLVTDNSPALLTAMGVTGALTTAYLTGRASFKAAELLGYERLDEARRLEKQGVTVSPTQVILDSKTKVQLTWKLYIPAVTTGALTVAAIIFANRIGSRRAAALALAYSISDRAFEEYKAKVVEKLGDKKEEAIRAEVAQDRVNRMPVGDREIIVTGTGSVLCQDAFSGRYFLCDMETLKKAQNDINYQVLHNSYASLSDFYEMIGLTETSVSGDVGWNADKLLEMKITTAMTEYGNKPCIVVDFTVAPVRHYNRLQ